MRLAKILKRPLVGFAIVFIFAAFLYTHKLLQIPPGIETDEGSIAYNSALISKNLRDQNNRFLPFFILSMDKVDWKQPVLIYTSAIAFKLFGTSLIVFKYVNVLVTLSSLVILWIVLRMFFSDKEVLIGAIVFATTPMIIVAARLGNEGIWPALFSSLWILFICKFRNTDKIRYLILSGLTLGISIYCYKGMRLIAPLWIVMTSLYIYWHSLVISDFKKIVSFRLFLTKIKNSLFNKSFLKKIVIFTLTILPFFAVMPILESKYAGAVFDRTSVKVESYRHLSYYWLSNLNPGFLFGNGEVGKIFQVELYGTFLLSTLPFFLIGLKKSFDKINFFTFISVSFLVSPILFGMAGTFGYGHRLIAMIPLYVVITTLGIQVLGGWLKKLFSSTSAMEKSVAILTSLFLSIFFIINFSDFASYYYFEFPRLNDTKISFSDDLNQPYYELSQKSKVDHLTPFIQGDIYYKHGEGNKFFEVAYFDKPVSVWDLGQKLPERSVLLTQNAKIDGMNDSGIDVLPLYILVSN